MNPLKRFTEPVSDLEPEDDLTLCIGALARDDDNSFCIVTCSDKLESNDFYGAETLHKIHVLPPDLFMLFADSPARAKELQLLFEAHLKQEPLKASHIVQQLEIPLITLKRRLAESFVGRRLGMSYGEVLKEPDKWRYYLDQVDQHTLRATLIIGGFLEDRPILLQTIATQPDPQPRLEWVQNYAAIGSGGLIAEAWLAFREQDQNTRLWNTLYNLFEAKKQAQIGPPVGKKITRLVIWRRRGEGQPYLRATVITPEGISQLENLYKQYGPKPTRELYDTDITGHMESLFTNPITR